MTDDGTSYKGITFDQLIPILTQAIRELYEKNLDLTQQNIELQKYNNTQDKTISNILVHLNNMENNCKLNLYDVNKYDIL